MVAQRSLGIGKLDAALELKMAEMFHDLKTQPLWLVLLAMAVLPAVFEELFFRGLVYHALAARARPAQAIIVSAALFGLFHLFALGALATPRLLPSTLMGLLLGWVCYRSGSVLPGMVLHAFHNGAALSVAYYVRELDVASWGMVDQPHMPAAWLWLSAGGVLLGGTALMLHRRRRHEALCH
jgi:ABC-2 type transport system permease protein/sodium transport system permease protein